MSTEVMKRRRVFGEIEIAARVKVRAKLVRLVAEKLGGSLRPYWLRNQPLYRARDARLIMDECRKLDPGGIFAARRPRRDNAGPRPDPAAEDGRMALAGRIREARVLNGWSQKELAVVSGFQQNQVSRWELGQSLPSPLHLVRLASTLGTTVGTLCGVEESRRDPSTPDDDRASIPNRL